MTQAQKNERMAEQLLWCFAARRDYRATLLDEAGRPLARTENGRLRREQPRHTASAWAIRVEAAGPRRGGAAFVALAAEVRALTGEEVRAALGKDGALYLTIGEQNPLAGPLGTPA